MRVFAAGSWLVSLDEVEIGIPFPVRRPGDRARRPARARLD
ncbi:MAG: hypothetical protein WKG00_18345 [Polyangiaceae bacterium]